MKQTFYTDEILLHVLENISPDITGDIYLSGERPSEPIKEDIVINTIELTQDCKPQIGISYITIYVPDTEKTEENNSFYQANRNRIQTICERVCDMLYKTTIEGISLTIVRQLGIEAEELQEHSVTIQIEWIIYN